MKIIRWNTSRGKEALEAVKNRQNQTAHHVGEQVQLMLDQVKAEGDQAVFSLTRTFDKADLTAESIKVTKREMVDAVEMMDPEYLKAMENARDRILKFHRHQRQLSWYDEPEEGIMLGQKVTPLDSVGIYVPGGTAAYPSSVLMNALPARVAGVRKIVMVTPPNAEGRINPVILAAAHLAGVEEIYKVGGAQAVAALAYGTETIPRVDKITGPGNQYVATAKKKVYGQVDIDMIAGPSEILVLADESANPKYVAADLLSQAEHDEMASAICVTSSHVLAEKIVTELERQLDKLERHEIARKSLQNFGGVWVTQTMEEAVRISNELAPEHLELCVEKPFELLSRIRHAGAIFLGHYTPEPIGDYLAGPNHVLPTGGTARFHSPLSVEDFVKKSSIIYFTQAAMENVADDVVLMAGKEGLEAHGKAVEIRKREQSDSKDGRS